MNNTKKTKAIKNPWSDQVDHILLSQFHNKLASHSKLTLEELKEVSELHGFSNLPISDLRLVTEMMGGLTLVSARREGNPSRIQCLSYIETKFQEDLSSPRKEGNSFASIDEPHDYTNDPSSEDSDSESEDRIESTIDIHTILQTFQKCLDEVMS